MLIGALLIAGARAIGTTQLYQLGYVLLALLPISLALGLYGARGISVKRRLPDEIVSAEDTTEAELRLEGTSRLPGLSFELFDHLPDRVRVGSTPADEEGRVFRLPVTFPRRGRYTVGPVEVQFRDPFGLLIFRRKAGKKEEVLVYPPLRDLKELRLHPGSSEIRGSPAFTGRGEEFSGLREYRRGDEPRHIHWKSVARTGELHVKEFTSEAPTRHTVVLDLSSTERVEWAVSVAGSVLYQLLQRGLVFSLVCNGFRPTEMDFGEDRESFRRAMGLLAVAEPYSGRAGASVPGISDGGGKLGESVVVVASGAPPVQSVLGIRESGIPVTLLAASAEATDPLEEAGARVVYGGTEEIGA
jgi:uncharacterized protein (DUF58 family)